MDKSELTAKMLEWEAQKKVLDALEDVIKHAVMTLEETFIAGNVRATFSGGRKTYDYESAGKTAPQEVIDKFTTPKVDWRLVCEEAKFDAVPFTVSNPSVTIKLDTK